MDFRTVRVSGRRGGKGGVFYCVSPCRRSGRPNPEEKELGKSTRGGDLHYRERGTDTSLKRIVQRNFN